MKKIAIILMFCLLASFVFACPIHKQSYATEVMADYKGMVVIEQNSKRVLNEYQKDMRLPMASTTKIMTALIIMENCNNLDKEITIDDRSVGIEGTSIYLRKGERLTLKELLAGMMLPSGNDAASALAYHLCPTMEKFATMMNEKAKQLNLTNTNFQNSHGLDAKEHYTSAYDLAIISSEAMKYEFFADLVSQPSLQIRGAGGEFGEIRFLKNKNKFLKVFDGATGIKTGFTDNAGRCLVASSKRGNLDLICVLLNCPNMFEIAKNLMNKTFENYNYVELIPPYNCYRKIQVIDGKQEEVKLYTRRGFSYPLTKEEGLRITYNYNLPDNLVAPIKKEQVVGEVEIKLDKELLFKELIYASDEIKSIDILNSIKDILENWL